jgi:RNA-directed DNA polymerase
MGTPQGGVISPVLANLFMHYAFDEWMKRKHPNNPWARYADDAVIHGRTLKEAEALLIHLEERFTECHLELNREKTRIVYCRDDDRKGNYPVTSFDFLGYTFRPRRSKNRWGKYFINFSPAVSNAACKRMRQTIRGWRLHLKVDRDIEDLSRMFNPVVRGWINYYSRFYKSQLYGVLRHLDRSLIFWVRRKYKKMTRHKQRASAWLARLAKQRPELFAHWQMGLLSTVGSWEPDEPRGCAVSRTEGIATRGGRSSGQMTPRRTTDLDPKGRGNNSMCVKPRTSEDVWDVARRRLSNTAKAELPESQCPGAEAHARR